MGVEIAEGVVTVTADGSNISRDLGREISRNQGPFESAGDDSARSFGGVFKGSFFGNFLGNIASDIVSNIGYAIGTGIKGAIEFGIGTIAVASDLNESINAVTVAYGDIGDEILGLGKDSAKTFGLSKRDLNSYAVQFSAFSKGIAAAGNGDVAGTFESILGRATDFASVMNVEVADALGLFQSGLAGETEPLRKYGIDLSAAAVEAYALANGIGDGTAPLTEQQKQLARYGYLLEQTSSVQGDFANTSDSLANANRINAATWDDIQAKIGTAFLPVAEDLAGILADDILPAISSFVDEYGPEFAKVFEDLTPILQGFVEDVLPKLPELMENTVEAAPGFIQFLSDFGAGVVDFSNGVGAVAQWFGESGAAIEEWELGSEDAVAGFFASLGDKFALGGQQIIDFTSGVITWFDTSGKAIEDWQLGSEEAVASFFGSIGPAVSHGIGEFTRFMDGVGTNMGKALEPIASFPQRAVGALGDLGNTLFSSGQDLIGGFIDGIEDMIDGVGDAVSGVVEWAASFFPHSPAKRGPLSGSGWTAIGKSGEAFMTQWTSGFARPDLTGALKGVGEVFGSSVAPAGGGRTSARANAPAYAGASSRSIPLIGGDLVINEAEDPLGSAGRVSKTLRQWKG